MVVVIFESQMPQVQQCNFIRKIFQHAKWTLWAKMQMLNLIVSAYDWDCDCHGVLLGVDSDPVGDS